MDPIPARLQPARTAQMIDEDVGVDQ